MHVTELARRAGAPRERSSASNAAALGERTVFAARRGPRSLGGDDFDAEFARIQKLTKRLSKEKGETFAGELRRRPAQTVQREEAYPRDVYAEILAAVEARTRYPPCWRPEP